MHAPETEPEFTLTSPDDIRAALFELQHADSLIGVRNAADREFAVELAGIDTHSPRFYCGRGTLQAATSPAATRKG